MNDVTIGTPGTATATFSEPRTAADGSGTLITLSLSADGLTAHCAFDLDGWSDRHQHGLQSYLQDLAVHWRGWAGTKHWVDAGGVVEMRATHDGVGHVLLEITASPLGHVPRLWSLQVTMPIEPGSLDEVAARFTSFVRATVMVPEESSEA